LHLGTDVLGALMRGLCPHNPATIEPTGGVGEAGGHGGDGGND